MQLAQRLPDDAGRLLFNSRQCGEEALNGFIPELRHLLGRSIGLVDTLDRRRRADVHEARVASTVLLWVRVPVLTRGAEMHAEATDQQCDVCAEAAAVAVDLVEHEVPAPVVRKNGFAIRR